MRGAQHSWVKHLIKDFTTNPHTQYKFHIVMMLFWMLNAAAGTAILLLLPNAWVVIGVYYVFMLSIYANWDTDYDAVSASQASMHGEELIRRADAADAIRAVPPEDEEFKRAAAEAAIKAVPAQEGE